MDPTAIVTLSCTAVGICGSVAAATVMIVRKLKKKYKLKLEEKPDEKAIREEVIQEALKTLKELKAKDELTESSFRAKLENVGTANQLYPSTSRQV